jgi:hypothetical protein
MSSQVLHRSSCTVTLSGEERDGLLELLRQARGDGRVEADRTHASGYRDVVLDQQTLVLGLIEKLERPGPDPASPTPVAPTASGEAPPIIDELYIDAEGRFQIASDDMVDFLDFLRDHGIHVQVEATKSFHSAGHAYGIARLMHLYDVDSTSELYRTWEKTRGRGVQGATA